jgi:hypothetical protein
VFEYDNEDNPVRWVQFPVGKHGMSKDRWSLYRRDHGGWVAFHPSASESNADLPENWMVVCCG